MDIARKLTYLRTQKGCSQEDIADELGVSRQTISKWELGNAVPDTAKIVDLSNFYNVSTDYLLKDEYDGEAFGGIDRIAIRFMNSAKTMNSMSNELVEIAKDGLIDAEEKKQLKEMCDLLDQIKASVDELRNIVED